ncbi:carboxypeptidase regulatory-like domain-containing protein [Granulicella cerasi]|uniref:Carboxypeptidase regulatory-like domain-containing protein n=1 Tax=Granulicella cerasi TaxID=741063 RepID=A0ABW1Z8F8_9BACT
MLYPSLLAAQQRAGTAASAAEFSGTVSDPSGARISAATVQLARNGKTLFQTTSDGSGQFHIPGATGSYDLVILAPGFEAYVRHITVGRTALNARLQIATTTENVQVDGSDHPVGLSQSDNAAAMRLDEKKMAALSDDDSTFQQQLLALAGNDDSHPAKIYVDGFSGGQIPPKDTIREVHINENPYSAEYDSMGMGRIEVFTKAGTGKWHGNIATMGNDSSFNSRSPYLYANSQPDYYRFYISGGANGPIGKKSSLYVNTQYDNQQNNAIVNAVTNTGNFSTAAPAPQLKQDYSLRFDRQLATNDSFTTRYEFNRNAQSNAGVSQYTLPIAGYGSGVNSHTLQIGETHIFTPHLELETRFQWQRTGTSQNANSGLPSIQVQGSFTGGGATLGANRNANNLFDFEEQGSYSRGAHLVRYGFRARTYHLTSYSTSGFNGTYTFPDLASYAAHTPSQVTLTAGQANFEVSTSDFAWYLEDEWKLTKNLTVDAGLRIEAQTAVPDHWDPSPHLGAAWGIGPRKNPTAVVWRTGAAIYYDRMEPSYLLTSVQRANNTAQQSYLVSNPGYVSDLTAKPSFTSATVDPSTLTTYSVAPNLRTQYSLNAGTSLDVTLGNKGSLSISYNYDHYAHVYLSRNANAPLNGVQPYGAAAGQRYQYASLGDGSNQWLGAYANYQVNKDLVLWANIFSMYGNSDSGGTSSFVSNSYNVKQDAGQLAWVRHVNLFSGINATVPFTHHFLDITGFLLARSGSHFNITTGYDNNGDSIYNDRPSFATAASDPANVVRTQWGTFNTRPVAGETIIPMNYGTSSGFFSTQLRLSHGMKFGPPAKAPKPGEKAIGRYDMRFALEVQNVTNSVMPARPVGVLSSSNFGKVLTSANSFIGNTAANRTLTLSTTFRF